MKRAYDCNNGAIYSFVGGSRRRGTKPRPKGRSGLNIRNIAMAAIPGGDNGNIHKVTDLESGVAQSLGIVIALHGQYTKCAAS